MTGIWSTFLQSKRWPLLCHAESIQCHQYVTNLSCHAHAECDIQIVMPSVSSINETIVMHYAHSVTNIKGPHHIKLTIWTFILPTWQFTTFWDYDKLPCMIYTMYVIFKISFLEAGRMLTVHVYLLDWELLHDLNFWIEVGKTEITACLNFPLWYVYTCMHWHVSHHKWRHFDTAWTIQLKIDRSSS